ncbi:Unknown protein sequence [Pseudomonas savastanoi pv. phaseolicola]|nr:Unknown protein sequence [Pseudomonas savastanoi pv. phaseolicola]
MVINTGPQYDRPPLLQAKELKKAQAKTVGESAPDKDFEWTA